MFPHVILAQISRFTLILNHRSLDVFGTLLEVTQFLISQTLNFLSSTLRQGQDLRLDFNSEVMACRRMPSKFAQIRQSFFKHDTVASYSFPTVAYCFCFDHNEPYSSIVTSRSSCRNNLMQYRLQIGLFPKFLKI